MRMVNVTKLFASGLMISLLAACSNQHNKMDAATTTTGGKEAITSTTDTEQVSADTQTTQDPASLASAIIDSEVSKVVDGQTTTDITKPLVQIVYFDLDKSKILDEFHKVLDGHAAYLRQNPQARILLQGHADERGTREYNMALGERRGHAVGRYLVIQGVSIDAVEVVSFGEERPIQAGRDEASWAENRRVEIRYMNY